MPAAASFYDGGRFSAVRTLSSKSTALIALSDLPIEVPYHSVIGQQHSGPANRGSDGVVPYWSSHLDGASSELFVHSGHNVISNPEAIREVIRILHQDERSFRPSIDASTLFPRNRAPIPHRRKVAAQIGLNNG